ncbi:hypothetical protein JCM18920_2998 [Cutibacterium acnes JCM 18920]|nr:hypothetical protein JCM18920_2998 [Cutibacterium acnes JCM 18920]
MDLADLVGLAGVVKDALGRRRLAGIDVAMMPMLRTLLRSVLATVFDLESWSKWSWYDARRR